MIMATSPSGNGMALVRRFTDDLKGQTTLERATINAQQEHDAIQKTSRRRRMDAMYREPDRPEQVLIRYPLNNMNDVTK